ncbi:MAG TPA: hypothetical protein VF202_13890 [Trueperaceae bacterium]
MPGITISIVLALVTGFSAAGCSGGANEEAQAGAAETASAATPISGATATPEPADSLGKLIEKLGQLPGSFERTGRSGAYAFTGDRNVIHAIVLFEDAAVPRLVDCLDNTEPAAATLNGEPVPVGVMCYEALRFTASYEATDEQGDLDPTWPGYIGPDATAEDLRAAKGAWEEVVRRKAYVIP